jgi:molybdate transport system substrate-binding protein
MKRSLAVLTLTACCLIPAQDTEVTLIAPGGAKAAIEQLIPGFERTTGFKVKATFGSGLGTKKQVASGEAFDVPVVQPPYPEVLASGNVVPSSAHTLASVAVGVAVRKGAPHPDISTSASVRQMLLNARSIAYPNPSGGAAAGVSFEDTLRRLGISAEVASKVKLAQGGAGAMTMAANGEVEIGLTFMSEMETPGIDVIGPLPTDISTPTSLVGFVSTHAKNPAAAKSLLDYLTAPDAAAVYKRLGMQPGR